MIHRDLFSVQQKRVEERIDIKVLSLELVPRSLVKSGFWTDS